VPLAAWATLRLISAVVALCSSTAAATASTRETAATLATITDELRALVSRFELP
jgi:methyl-accepting chemotaxis protein